MKPLKIWFLSTLLVFSTAVFVDAGEPISNTVHDLTELDIEELMEIEVATVYGASKYQQAVTRAPASVSIITASDVKKYGYRTLADILRSVRGFYVSYDRNYHYLGLRGFSRPGDYDTRYLLLVDGHRINDNIYDSTFIGTDFILDVDLIDRVEIIRGPGSSLYGSNAVLGIINVITRKGHFFNGPELSGEAASYDTYKARVSYGNKFKNDLEMLFSGSFYNSEGRNRLHFDEFDDPETNNGIAEDGDYDDYKSFFGELSLRELTLQGAYIFRKKGIPTAPWGIEFNDPRNRSIDERGYVDLKYERTIEDVDVLIRLFYDHYKYDGSYVYDYSRRGKRPRLFVNKDYVVGKWWGSEFTLTKPLLENHKLTLGAEYRDNFKQDQKNYDKKVYLDDTRDTEFWALYIQDEYSILDNLILNLGLRHDHYSTFGSTTNPRLALIYSPLDKTTLKLIYGEAFRAPNVYELYYNDYPVQKANPDLDPEKIKTYELIVEQLFENNIYLTASGFFYKIDDLITLQTDPSDDQLVFNNVDEVETKGAELEVGRKWDSGMEGRVSYSFQEAEDKTTDSLITNSPKHLAKFNMIVPILREKLFIGIEEQYTSRRKTVAGNHADDFYVTNLTLFSQRLRKGFEISGSVYNLLNKKYDDPGSIEHLQDLIEQDGRTFRLKLTYKF